MARFFAAAASLAAALLLSGAAPVEAFHLPAAAGGRSAAASFAGRGVGGVPSRRGRRGFSSSSSSSSALTVGARIGGALRSAAAGAASVGEAADADGSSPSVVSPQVFATGYSPHPDLLTAIQEATDAAILNLPPPLPSSNGGTTTPPPSIDLAIVTVSSLYDGQSSPSVVVPAVLSSGSTYGSGIRNLVGCTAGGIVGSVKNDEYGSEEESGTGGEKVKNVRECLPVESEGVPGVSVTLALLPDVEVNTFHVHEDDVPDDVGRSVSADSWKSAVGLRGVGGRGGSGSGDSDAEDGGGGDGDGGGGIGGGDAPTFMLLPSPGFQTSLDDFLRGLSYSFPRSTSFGAIASTVSSLSRARLFRHDASDPQCIQTVGDGCVGVSLRGDIETKVMVAQGAKPVGGIYRVVSGQDSTIGVIMLDEAATKEETAAEEDDEEDEEEEDDGTPQDAKAIAAAAYAKAQIPKPVLAEANYLMKSLSDDDRSFMRKAILVGLERGGSMGRTPGELVRLAEGEGHRFAVHQVASAGMKDGSVTLPLGSVDVQKGQRLRFFVREGKFARREVQALWTGYKKRSLEDSIMKGKSPFEPTGALVLTTLDRGTKMFGGKPGYESGVVSSFLPSAPSISGFFSNGVLGRLSDDDVGDGASAVGADDVMVHGSAACYAVFGSKTKRPIFSPAAAAAAEAAAKEKQAEEDAAAKLVEEEDEKRTLRTKELSTLHDDGSSAPRSSDGELILKRREVHSGRAISVSTVEWSVAEKTATPTSALEGFMWDKEAEVDRFRERVPLSNLVSQCKLASVDPTKPKPRDWIGPIKEAGEGGEFVIIPECKRMEPTTGSLRKRYDVSKLVGQLTAAGAPAISVNCDAVLFGGSAEDVTKAREASSKAVINSASSDEGIVAPPILASDLLLYPYQLYKLRLAGADAVNLVVGALETKDLLYLTKIAASLQMQIIASVASEVQIRAVNSLSKGSVSAIVVSNRELEDFSFDDEGARALELLKSDALKEFREKNGEDVPVLVEGRVGIVQRLDENGELSAHQYIKELQEAGAFGAIVGGGLAEMGENGGDAYESLLTSAGSS